LVEHDLLGKPVSTFPDHALVDEPHLPRQVPIDAHGAGGFRFGGMSHRGSVLCLPRGIWAWPVVHPGDVTNETLSRVFAATTDLDFFIIGSGTTPWRPPDELRARFREAHVSLDAMTTGPAVRTFNVMLMEGRRVGAGLIAIA
jgi:uncharacterized protein